MSTTTLSRRRKVFIHLKSALARITLTPHTLAFFLISVIHCVAQGLTAAFIYSEDASSFKFVDDVVRTADVPDNEVARLFRVGNNLDLKLCTAIPLGSVFKDCETVYTTDPNANLNVSWALVERFLADVEEPRSSILVRRGPDDSSLEPVKDGNGNVVGVELTYDNGNEQVTFSQTCARTLEYPLRILDNSWREDLALIASQFWLLAMSSFGILFNSIPHIWAVVFARVLQTGWATYTLWRTYDVQFRYNTLIVDPPTPCHFDVLPQYFSTRVALQIPELVLNITALISSFLLAWRVVKGYSTSTIRRVMPSLGVMRLYKFFLINCMFAELSLFFTLTAVALWLDQLVNSSIARLALHPELYWAIAVFSIVTIIPWMVMGWFAIRRELKWLMAGFVLLNVIYIVSWGGMFDAQVYAWTFVEWPFFACTMTVSLLVQCGALVFAAICWRGFGKGLAHYIHVEQVLLESDFDADVFMNEDVEKKGGSPGGLQSPIRAPSALSEFSGEGGVNVMVKDRNWDFADVDRPAIYDIVVQTSKRSLGSGSSESSS
ncbi:hypothetical protein GSI_11839 [Ganoderma sinense ZZ0214-1]|uniref:Uncharacterized protein n=1 Tax=Ganoderma sinense ZZ0214-1 TaxID=1077348 RepID=A0A2G8RX36_9APHY|nr:hypothetical protein GSI_11839 [Ganoderma sinense ZZ0214-1]